jgi:ribonuclease E
MDFAAPVPAPVQAAPRAPAMVVASRQELPEGEPAATPELPKVKTFELPVDQLARIAEGSGLQWVNSNGDKIAAVQAAIAAEPKPVHVPRERPPLVPVADGPLVLVETQRDLAALKLPFEDS